MHCTTILLAIMGSIGAVMAAENNTVADSKAVQGHIHQKKHRLQMERYGSAGCALGDRISTDYLESSKCKSWADGGSYFKFHLPTKDRAEWRGCQITMFEDEDCKDNYHPFQRMLLHTVTDDLENQCFKYLGEDANSVMVKCGMGDNVPMIQVLGP